MWIDFKTTRGSGVVGGAGIEIRREDVGMEMSAKVERRQEHSWTMMPHGTQRGIGRRTGQETDQEQIMWEGGITSDSQMPCFWLDRVVGSVGSRQDSGKTGQVFPGGY